MTRSTTVCLVLLLVGAAAAAEDPDAWLAWDRWEPLQLRRKARTEFGIVQMDGRGAMRAESRCAASAMAVALDPIDLGERPVLGWSWKVEKPLDPADERAKSGDDFAVRVYVMFRFQPERASWSQRLRYRAGQILYRRELPGSALNYVWTTNEPAGERWDNPFSRESKMISLGQGPLPDWRSERVDVVRDYELAFGHHPPEAFALAIMTDADNSCSRAVGLFADFEWVARSVD